MRYGELPLSKEAQELLDSYEVEPGAFWRICDEDFDFELRALGLYEPYRRWLFEEWMGFGTP